MKLLSSYTLRASPGIEGELIDDSEIIHMMILARMVDASLGSPHVPIM
jgi:hypothetical protein